MSSQSEPKPCGCAAISPPTVVPHLDRGHCKYPGALERIADLEHELKESNYWRERWANEQAAYAKRVGTIFDEKKELERQLAAEQGRTRNLEAELLGAVQSLIGYEKSYGGGGGIEQSRAILTLCGYDGDLYDKDEMSEWIQGRLAEKP